MTAPVFDPASQCEGKQRFANPALAWRVLKRRSLRRQARQMYRCVWCGKWHIGSAIPGVGRDDE
jgi:hypothetical protein